MALCCPFVCPSRANYHFKLKNDKTRPDAKCGVCCTLPAACSMIGLFTLKHCLCYDRQNKVAGIGVFNQWCSPCCSVTPIVDYLTEPLDRPPKSFLIPRDQLGGESSTLETRYSHCPFAEYASAVGTSKYEGKNASPASTAQIRDRRATDGGGLGTKKCPWIGQAGRAFGVTVPDKSLCQRMEMEGKAMPDPQVLWDRLFKRGQDFTPCPKGANALLTYTAMLATHEFFRTDAGTGDDGDGVERHWVNANSSFLDLQSLYGSKASETASIRTSNGEIHESTQGHRRLAQLPVLQAILKLLALEHNYIARELGKRALYKTDEDHFQAARAVLIAQFIQIISYDYVGGINGPGAQHVLERFLQNSRPYTDEEPEDYKPAKHSWSGSIFPEKKPQVAMHGSIEFKLMYQFHPAIPQAFTMEGGDFPHIDSDDAEAVLKEALKTPSGAFGPLNTPDFLEETEKDTIKRARNYGVCSYNDMRGHLNLPRAAKFSQMCTDKEVCEVLAELYPGGPDDLELYVGCTVESNFGWPSGWSLGDTLFNGLVTDALSSGIGDYFHTHAFSREHLSEWGYEHALSQGRLVYVVNRHTSLSLPRDFDIFRVPDQVRKDSKLQATTKKVVPAGS